MNLSKVKYSLLQIIARLKNRRKIGVASFHFGRCGSTVLGKMLEKHTDITWDHELFQNIKNKPEQILDLKFTQDNSSILRNRFNRNTTQIYGFETKTHKELHLGPDFLNMSFNDYYRYLKQIGVTHFIIHKRKNYLKQRISERISHQNQQWQIKKDERLELKNAPLDLHFKYGRNSYDLVDFFQLSDDTYKHIEETLRLNGDKYIVLNYENDIESDPFIAYKKVCDFLHINREKVEIELKKINNNNINDMISNYNEIKSHLSGTKYAWMLEE